MAFYFVVPLMSTLNTESARKVHLVMKHLVFSCFITVYDMSSYLEHLLLRYILLRDTYKVRVRLGVNGHSQGIFSDNSSSIEF